MPKTGGFNDPIIFLVAMMVVAMVISLIGFLLSSVLHIGNNPMGFTGSIAGALAGIVFGPIIAVVLSFIGAGILFIIWKIMGSQENYETAYRCAAYSSGIVSITTIIGFIPYLGQVIAISWGFYLIVIASILVHQIASSRAWTVWGIIAAVLIILTLSAQFTAKKFATEMTNRAKEAEKAAKDMEEMSKKMQESLSEMPQNGQMSDEDRKAMQESMQKMQEEIMKKMPKEKG